MLRSKPLEEPYIIYTDQGHGYQWFHSGYDNYLSNRQ